MEVLLRGGHHDGKTEPIPPGTLRMTYSRHENGTVRTSSYVPSDDPAVWVCDEDAPESYDPCRCCGFDVLPFVAGSYPDERLCDDCGRGKCSDCIDQVRKLWRSTSSVAGAQPQDDCGLLGSGLAPAPGGNPPAETLTDGVS